MASPGVRLEFYALVKVRNLWSRAVKTVAFIRSQILIPTVDFLNLTILS